MKRPLFAIGTSWFIATWLAFFCGDSVLQVSIASLLTALLFFAIHQKSTHPYAKYAYAVCVVMLSAAIAFAAFWLNEKRKVEPVLALAGTSAEVEGFITEAESGIRAMSYTIKARFTGYPGLPETTLSVRDYSGIERNAGDSVRFSTGLSAAPETAWYRSRGILLTGVSPENTESIPVGKYRLERALMRLRVLLSRNAYANLKEENADIVSAMVLGLKDNIPPELSSAFGKSGTAHLLSVSGLHLSVFSAAILGLLKKLGRPRTFASLATIVFSFLFSALVGFSASVFRAFIMTSATLLAGCFFSRRNDSLSSLGFALLVCGIARPHWVIGWGMWLSAASTLGIILFASKISAHIFERLGRNGRIQKRIAAYVSNALGVSFAAYAFTMPVLFLMSGWVSVVSPLANLLVSPFIFAAIFGGAACAFIPAGSPVIGFISAATNISPEIIVRVSEALGSLDFAIFALDESWMLVSFSGASAIIAALVIFRKPRLDKRLLAYAAALTAVCFCAGDLSLAAANRGKTELVTFSGHDAAVLLRGGEAVILGTPDAYEISNLLKYLAFRGVKNIPAVIATDCPDNVGSGLLRLSRAYGVDCVVAPNDAYIEDALARALPHSMVYSGGYAEIAVLGNTVIQPDLSGVDMRITIGKNEIVKIRRECDIIESGTNIQIFNGGKMLLPEHTAPLFEPVGAFLFGESRILMDL